MHYSRAKNADGSFSESSFDIYTECIVCSKDTQTMHKFCVDCKKSMSRADQLAFYKAKYFKDNPVAYEDIPRDPEVIRKYSMKYLYGCEITLLDELYLEQENRCAICGFEEPPKASGHTRLHVDHDHTSGMVRGLLCMRCNTGIGMLRDSTDILRNAIKYLEKGDYASTSDIRRSYKGQSN